MMPSVFVEKVAPKSLQGKKESDLLGKMFCNLMGPSVTNVTLSFQKITYFMEQTLQFFLNIKVLNSTLECVLKGSREQPWLSDQNRLKFLYNMLFRASRITFL